MNTSHGLDIDLNLVVVGHEEEECAECDYQGVTTVATWHAYMSESCRCLVNPLPVCEMHKEGMDWYLEHYGPQDWVCAHCGHIADLVKLTRIPR